MDSLLDYISCNMLCNTSFVKQSNMARHMYCNNCINLLYNKPCHMSYIVSATSHRCHVDICHESKVKYDVIQCLVFISVELVNYNMKKIPTHAAPLRVAALRP